MDKIETPEEFAQSIEKAIVHQYQQSPNGRGGLIMISKDYIPAGKLITARDALIRSDERRKGGWISVKERLPEENHAVLIYYDKHMIEAMFFDGDWGLPNGDWIMGHTVSFWMPLPFPPAIIAEPEEAKE